MLLTEEEEDKAVTQEIRQTHFVNDTTTDDHNIHIIGIAKNKTGKDFYLMKNSEGENVLGGYVFMSKKALLLKTISVLMHKDGLTQEVKNGLD